MPVHENTSTPTAMPARPERASQPRPSFIRPVIAVPSVTMPLASENAPNRSTSAYRLMPGQTRMTTAKATDRAPLIPSAQRSLLMSLSVAFLARWTTDSIVYLPIRLTGRLSLWDRETESESALMRRGNPAACTVTGSGAGTRGRRRLQPVGQGRKDGVLGADAGQRERSDETRLDEPEPARGERDERKDLRARVREYHQRRLRLGADGA